MVDDKEKLDDKTKLNLIIYKLENIETGLFKLIEEKLTSFRGELSDLVDSQFAKLQEYMSNKLSGVQGELEEKIEDHENRITVVEKEIGIKMPNKEDKKFNFRKNMTLRFIFVAGGATLINAILMGILLYIFKG